MKTPIEERTEKLSGLFAGFFDEGPQRTRTRYMVRGSALEESSIIITLAAGIRAMVQLMYEDQELSGSLREANSGAWFCSVIYHRMARLAGFLDAEHALRKAVLLAAQDSRVDWALLAKVVVKECLRSDDRRFLSSLPLRTMR